jgi:quinol monooxygenase YgiN
MQIIPKEILLVSIVFVVEFKGKEGKGNAIIEWFRQGTTRMTKADGLKTHRLYRNSENPDTILSIEEWESEEAHKAVMHKSGVEDWTDEDLNDLLAEPLDGTYHHPISEQSWP